MVPPVNERICTITSASWAYASAIDLTRSSMCPSAQVAKSRAIPLCACRCTSICRTCPSFDGSLARASANPKSIRSGGFHLFVPHNLNNSSPLLLLS
jgi:hypothetical protein